MFLLVQENWLLFAPAGSKIKLPLLLRLRKGNKMEKKKKKWIIIAVVALVVLIGGFGGSDDSDDELSFTLTAGEAGEYGQLITYNKDTEFEETFYAYYIPEGTYTVTNVGEYMSQLSVYSNETVITDAGWEEPESTGDVKSLDVGESDTITVEEGQHVEIMEPAEFELARQ